MDPFAIRSPTRHGSWYTDLGRGLAQTRRDDAEAISYLLRSKHVAPQLISLNPPVRDTVSSTLRRSRHVASGSPLLVLAERVGLASQ